MNTSHVEPERATLSGTAAHLTDAMRTVAVDLNEEAPADRMLRELTAAAAATIPGVRYAGITLVARPHSVETVAATDVRVNDIDAHQYRTGQGPCLDALWESPVVAMPDRSRESRWPAFTEALSDLGIASMLSFRMFAAGERLGALNLYADTPNVFDDDATQLGSLFAVHAAVVLMSARKLDQLQHAMSSRDLIGQAKGILMERHQMDSDMAFAMLVRMSHTLRTKLVQVADDVVRSAMPHSAR